MALPAPKAATKKQAKLKMCLVGPSGSGKTFTSLLFARQLAGKEGKILVLDTEKGSASLYADPRQNMTFDVIELWARDEQRQPIPDPFHPHKYIETIQIAENNGYDVLVIDSLSQAWMDNGGFLDLVKRIADRKYKGNSVLAWNDISPLQREFINAITDARLHIIATMRSKTEISMEKDEATGRTLVKKLGTKPVQRDDLEYEFTLYCQMLPDNTLIVEKTRCAAVNGATVHFPTGTFLVPVQQWLEEGAPQVVEEATQVEEQLKQLRGQAKKRGLPVGTGWTEYWTFISDAIGETVGHTADMTATRLSQLQEYIQAH